jgi:hypothetical protein
VINKLELSEGVADGRAGAAGQRLQETGEGEGTTEGVVLGLRASDPSDSGPAGRAR